MQRYDAAALSALVWGVFLPCNLIVFCALRTSLQRSEKLLAAWYVKWELSLAPWP